VASSVAIAVFGSLNTTEGQQLLLDRGPLMGAGTYAGGQLAGPSGIPVSDPGGVLGTYRALTSEITTTTYANGFYIVSLLAAAGAVLAVFMRSGGHGGGEKGAVEM
jgi:hypothetical protein